MAALRRVTRFLPTSFAIGISRSNNRTTSAMATSSSKKKLVLALGDSHTFGQIGSAWLAKAAQEHPSLRFVNAGVNGQTASAMLARLPALLEEHGSIDAFVLLAGTNDVLAQHTPRLGDMYKRAGNVIGGEPSPALHAESVAAILRDVRAASPRCAIAVATLPPLGENLAHAVNAAVRAHNDALRAAAAAAPGGPPATLVDFYGACAAHLERVRGGAAAPKHAAAPPGGWEATPWFLIAMRCAVFAHRWLGLPLDRVSSLRGLHLLIDHVHLNDAAGRLLLDGLRPFFERVAAA